MISASVWLTAEDHDELHRRIVGVSEFLTEGFGYVDDADRPVQDRSWLDQLTAQDSNDSEVIG